MQRRTAIVPAVLLLACGTAAGCSGSHDTSSPPGASGSPSASPASLPQGSEPVQLDPADFTTKIDNPYWPMVPGTRWVYRETDGQGGVLRDVVTVERRTKLIANGIEARVVHDVATEDGELVEDTFDWYAQDADGNVWYLGEDTKELLGGGIVNTSGSWLAGKHGAKPGLIMEADPQVPDSYRQECRTGEAEDLAWVVGRGGSRLRTLEFSPLEPSIVERKVYKRGVGVIAEQQLSGGHETLSLVHVTG